MKILYLILISIVASFSVYSQSTLPLRADTILLEKIGGNANFKLRDASKDSTGGILTNIGGGVYRGKKPRKITDTSFLIGNDTIAIRGKSGTNIANAALIANGDYTQNWKHFQWYIDSISSITWKINEPSTYNTLNRFRYNKNISNNIGNALQEGWTLEDQSGFDSLSYNVLSNYLGTSLVHQGGNTLSQIELNGGFTIPEINIQTFGSGSNSLIKIDKKITLNPTDSLRLKAIPAATADSVLGVRAYASGLNTVVKFPVPSGGAGTPGGSNTQIQFNDASAFGGDAGLAYNKTTNTVTTDSVVGVLAHLDSVRLRQTFSFAIPDSILFSGNSFTAGLYATVPDSDYVHRMAAYYNLPFRNLAISSTGIFHSADTLNRTLNPGHHKFTSVMAGYNNLRFSTGSTLNAKTKRMIINGYKSITASQFLSTYAAGGSSGTTGLAISRLGSWTTSYASNSVGGRGGTNGAYTTTLNDTLFATCTSCSNFVIGGIGADAASGAGYNYSSKAYVIIDGSLVDSISESNQADGFADAFYDDKRSPMVWFFSGLSAGAHTMKIVQKDASNYLIIDYIGLLKDAKDCTPLLLWHAAYDNITGYAVSPANSSVAKTQTLNTAIDSLFTTWPYTSYPAYKVATNNCFDTLTGLYIDEIHPNDIGHGQLSVCGIAALPSIQPTSTNGTITYASNGYYGTVNSTTRKFLLQGDTDSATYILNQNSYNQNANFKINGTGYAGTSLQAGTASKIGSGLSQTDAATVFGVISGNPMFSQYRSGAGTNEKIWDNYIDNNNMYFRVANDAMSSATEWLRVNRTGTTPNYVDFNTTLSIKSTSPPANTDIYINSQSGRFPLTIEAHTDYRLSMYYFANINNLTSTNDAGTNGRDLDIYAAQHRWWNVNSSTYSERMRLTPGGNLMINSTTDNGSKLQINGDATVTDDAYDATTWNGNITVPTKNAIRDKLESITFSNISNASLTANGSYTQDWNHNQLTFNNINQWSFNVKENDGLFGTRKIKHVFQSTNNYATQLLNLYSSIRNLADNADSILTGYRNYGSGGLQYSGLVTTSSAATGRVEVGLFDANINIGKGSKSSGVSLDTTKLTLTGNDSILIKGAYAAATADSILAIGPSLSDASNKLLKIPTGSGTWSPTLTADVNVDGTPTALHATYTRQGNIVTCYVTISVDPTLITIQTEVGIPLPIASNFTSSNDVSGCGAGSVGNGLAAFVQVSADTTNDRATLIFQSGSTSASIIMLTFQYSVL